MLWSWWAITGLLWVWRNRRGPHLEGRLLFSLERGLGIALQAMQEKKALSSRGRGRLRGFLELRRPWGLEGVPGLPGAPQDEAGLTRKFETSHVGPPSA